MTKKHSKSDQGLTPWSKHAKNVARILSPEELVQPIVRSHRQALADFAHLRAAKLAMSQPPALECLSPSG